jgi:hypothetical protein
MYRRTDRSKARVTLDNTAGAETTPKRRYDATIKMMVATSMVLPELQDSRIVHIVNIAGMGSTVHITMRSQRGWCWSNRRSTAHWGVLDIPIEMMHIATITETGILICMACLTPSGNLLLVMRNGVVAEKMTLGMIYQPSCFASGIE